MIERRNVLDLIGRHRGKYHSCILTCYNFDFSFFEERVLPVLRTANVKNVNVIADGNFLEQAQELTTGREFKLNNTYNFLPVYKKGAFHPKIMLLTGVKHGLLIIGSGNMTSSGLSTNDEIWGAFHLDNCDNENAALFASAWTYLQTFLSNTFGFLPQKLEWIKKYSPWLGFLPKGDESVLLTSVKHHVTFISDRADKPLYQQLISLIPAKNLRTLTLVSPYYDKKGSVLKQLLEDFNPKRFDCLVDTNSGLLPTNLAEEDLNRISFYDWQECVSDYKLEVNRLHAKMLHFHYNDGSEFLFFGSANASLAAFGNKQIIGSNSEAGILISRKGSGNWIKELKIKLPKTDISIDDYSDIPGLNSLALPNQKFLHKIYYSELKGTEITCYVNSIPESSIMLAVMTRNGLVYEPINISFHDNAVVAKITDVDAVFKVYLLSKDGKRVSNFSIVHRFEMLLRGNPDPSQEKFDALLDQEYSQGDDLTSLLDFLDYDWADDDTSSTELTSLNGARQIKSNDKKEDKTYKKLSKEEFNRVSSDILLRQAGLLSSANVKLADFLSLLLSGTAVTETDFAESEEQKLLEDTAQIGEGEKMPANLKSTGNPEKEKRALIRYFGKLDHLYSDKLKPFYHAQALTVTPVEQITIKSLSKILIALQLVHRYYGRKYTILNDQEEESAQVEEKYLTDGCVFDNTSTIKGFLINAVGKFLLLSTAGIKNYEYSILNDKIESYRQQLIDRVLCIILNVSWRGEEEKNYRLTLLLNLHYFLEPCENMGDNWKEKKIKRVDNWRMSGVHISRFFTENQEYYATDFLPNYIRWCEMFNSSEKVELVQDTSLLRCGDIIFSRKIGFNQIERVVRGNTVFLYLKRGGYLLNDDGYIIERVAYGQKCVRYL